jgi:hypothetical protein
VVTQALLLRNWGELQEVHFEAVSVQVLQVAEQGWQTPPDWNWPSGQADTQLEPEMIEFEVNAEE